MAGMLHSLKEKLFAGEKHVDAEYEAAFSKFTQLHDSLTRLKASTQNYSNSLYASLFNSNSAAIEFANILEDPLSENGYEIISKQMQTAHSQLNSDRQNALTQRMQESVLQPLDKLILQLMELNAKVARRNELHTNLEYYLGKVHELNKEREERGAKGKSESSSQREKMERNQHKLDGVRNEYTTYTQPLIKDLLSVWETRAVSVGPILTAFASLEKEYTQVYSAALQAVHPEQIGIAPGQAQQTNTNASPMPATTTAASAAAAAPTTVTSTITTSSGSTSSPVVQPQQANPFATPTAASAAPATVPAAVQDTVGAGSGNVTSSLASANVFGEINDPATQEPHAAILSIPVTVNSSGSTSSAAATGAPNPFDQQQRDVPASSIAPSAGGLEGVVSTISPVQSAALNKSEHEEESKMQRHAEEQKTQNVIGV